MRAIKLMFMLVVCCLLSVHSIVMAQTELQNGVAGSGTVSPLEQDRFFINVPAGATDLNVVLSGDDPDADLYLKYGGPPGWGNFDCGSWTNDSNEICSDPTPTAGTWHIMVYGYANTVDYEVVATYIVSSSDPDLVVQSIVTNPLNPDPGELVSVEVTVQNQGPSDAGEFIINWYHQLGVPPSPYQYGDAEEYVASLTAGATHTMSASYMYGTEGVYNMYAQVDTDQQVTESNEGNNVLGPKLITVGGCGPELENGIPCSGTVGSADEVHYSIDVPEGSDSLDIELTGNPDADLYVKYGSPPTTSNYDCRPYTGLSNESCPFSNPTSGTWYIMVRGYSGTVDYQIVATYNLGLPSPCPITCEGTLSPQGRWCDNGDGTVKDMTSGLVWLKKADWGGEKPWVDCATYDDAHTQAGYLYAGVPGADLSDGSVEGDWRLPTKEELNNVVNGTEPVLSSTMQLFTGVQSGNYWSSTTNGQQITHAWFVYMLTGALNNDFKHNSLYVWPVRGDND